MDLNKANICLSIHGFLRYLCAILISTLTAVALYIPYDDVVIIIDALKCFFLELKFEYGEEDVQNILREQAASMPAVSGSIKKNIFIFYNLNNFFL